MTLRETLTQLGAEARMLPPSWQDGDAWPILAGDATLGVVLPGLGLQLDTSFKALGLHRGPTIPYVVERPLWQRCLDTLGEPRRAAALAAACVGASVLSGEPITAPLMAGTLATFNDVVAAIGAGRSDIVLCNFLPVSTSFNSVVGQWMFPYNLFRPAPFAFSTGLSATAPTRSTSGALNGYAQAPGSGQTQILQAFHELVRTTGTTGRNTMYLLFDLLYECGGIVMNTTSTQTLGSAPITRYTNGSGVFMMVVTTLVSSNVTHTATVTYTNSSGTSGHTTTFVHNGNSGGSEYMIKPPFQPWPFLLMGSGDVGVRSVESLAWSGATGTGEMAMTLVKPLAVAMGKVTSEFSTNDFLQRLHPVVLADDACLALMPRLRNAAGNFRDYDATFALRFTSV